MAADARSSACQDVVRKPDSSSITTSSRTRTAAKQRPRTSSCAVAHTMPAKPKNGSVRWRPSALTRPRPLVAAASESEDPAGYPRHHHHDRAERAHHERPEQRGAEQPDQHSADLVQRAFLRAESFFDCFCRLVTVALSFSACAGSLERRLRHNPCANWFRPASRRKRFGASA